MSDDKASFEVELKNSVSKNAKSAAESFRDVHRAADGKGIKTAKAAIDGTEKSLKKTERALKSVERGYDGVRRSAKRAQTTLAKNDDIFTGLGKMQTAARRRIAARAFAGGSWDNMVRGNAMHSAQLQHNERKRQAQIKAQFAEARHRAWSERADKHEAKLRARNAMWSDMGSTFGGPAAIAGGALAVGGGIAAYETGKATLGAVKFRSEALEGLKLLTGSAGEANAVFKRSVDLADKLGLEWTTTVGGLQKLIGKGFSEDFATDLTKGLADLAIVAPDANIDNLLLAIGQIKTAGKLQGDELNQLTEAGLNSSLMFEVLEEKLGKSRDEVLKLKESGKLMADDVLPAILASIQKLTGKELGQAAEEATDTVAGTMRRLEQLPGRFFLAVADELEKSELEGSLKGLLEAFDPQSDAFAAGVETVAEAVQFAAEALDAGLPLAKELGSGFAEGIKAFLGIDTNEDFFEMWKDPETLAAVREWGQHLGMIAGALAKLLGMMVEFGPAIGGTADSAVSAYASGQGPAGALAAAATDMVAGFVKNLWDGQDDAYAAGAALGDAAIEGARGPEGVDAHSPSKKAGVVGDYVNQGLAGGVDGDLSRVERAGQNAGSAALGGIQSTASRLPDVLPAGSSGASGAPAGMSMGDFNLILQNLPPDATKSPEALARAIRAEIAKYFEGLAIQGTMP